MKPETILTIEDYELPRNGERLSEWWQAKYELFNSTKEGRIYSREGRGLSKKFYDEAQPMLAYMRHYHPGSDLICELAAGDDKADAQVSDTSGIVVRRFQITTAVDGYTEAMRRRQLTRVGHVDGLGKPDENGEIPDDGAYSDREQRIKEMAGYIASVVAMKSAKGYDSDIALIVGFDDSSYFPKDLPSFRALVGNLKHSFAELFIVGIHGRIALP